MFKKYYPQVPLVYAQIKEFLVHHGMYAPLSVSYINFSASRCYKIFNLLPHDSKEIFWNCLFSEYAKNLGWDADVLSDITDGVVREFVANVRAYDYAQYKKRCQKGKSVDFSELGEGIGSRQAKSENGKLRSFFKSIFTKE